MHCHVQPPKNALSKAKRPFIVNVNMKSILMWLWLSGGWSTLIRTTTAMTSQQVVNQRIRLKSDQSTWSSSTLGNNGCRKNKGKMEDGKHRSDILKYMSQCLCVYNNDSLGQSRPKVQQCCTQYLFDSYLSISFTSSCHNLYLYL